MTNVLDNELHDLGPLGHEIELARRVAEGTPGSHQHFVEQSGVGDTIERISADKHNKITITKELDPEVDKVRVNAQARHDDEEGGYRHVTARVFSTVYPDGDQFVNGNLEIHRRMPDGTEKVLTKTKSPKMAKAVGTIIADHLVEKIKNK